MMDERVAWLVLLGIATTLDGLLAGASVDQSEAVAARHRIGVRAYHAYTQASHMANGRFWLIPLGIGAPVLRIGAAVWARTLDPATVQLGAVYLAAAVAVAHVLSTIKAGRINWTLGPWQPPERRITDERELAAVFTRFERWQGLRASLQFLTFAVGVRALVTAR